MDHNIIVALIKAISLVLAAAVPTLVTYLVSKRYFGKRDYEKLERKYLTSLQDIEYLLEVERLHCRRNAELLDQSYRRNTRKEVECFTDLRWSGKYSQKRVYLERLKVLESINEA
ncbi:hypothetical protein [Vibrio alfacsensis]|uniref:hypothetical protein n=2 Tax=Vibrio TaxID=662 RepID=UPI00078DE1D7|nr:hypothetical protein [Vibrio alfacsensis]BAU70813.1 hypothetical protein [Vibrio sp. 04Ya108]BBM67618.1 hypothetical protein VA249_42640 [Vibrio alfacsensis]BCN27101.1 hypothetical protein VYA_42930 [Vibrio alfacsensis]